MWKWEQSQKHKVKKSNRNREPANWSYNVSWNSSGNRDRVCGRALLPADYTSSSLVGIYSVELKKLVKYHFLKLKAWLPCKHGIYMFQWFYSSHSSMREQVSSLDNSRNRLILSKDSWKDFDNKNKTVKCPIRLKNETLKPLSLSFF